MAHNQVEHLAQRKHFATYWSIEAVNLALEKGDVFKAMFRVNAHNRVEAYCKIDGLPVDVLISGFYSQNRAVEGDIVAIKVDPFSLWTKMKGSVEASPEKQLLHSTNDTFNGQDLIRPANFELDHTTASSPNEGREVVSLVEKLCTLITSFPSKRPTGRVVAIIETSPRRNSIVGFLRIKNWLSKKTKLPSSSPKHEHIQLIPTDPKFPKMIVPVKNLPNTITKRLDDCDLTLETDLIAAQIVEWSEEYDSPFAHVLHVFGRGGEVESQIGAILFQNSINSSDFTPEVMSCIPHLSWRIPEDELKHRRDLRNLCTFTIDPATASDLDDALSVEKLPNGVYRVGVHIADVSYFVPPHTPLDLEAQIRSTSVYLQKKKLPMLPPVLSDNLSSLSPGVERLAFSIIWDINLDGVVLDRWIGRTVIKSCCKLSYEQAQDILDGISNLYHPPIVITSVNNLYEISKVLKEKRFKDGALSLESPKIMFLFDKNGIPYDCVLSGRSKSNFLVEEFMLLANTTAAEVITRAYPSNALLRKHPEPKLSKLKDLETFCYKHGLHLNTSTSGQLHQSLENIRHELKDDSVLFHVLMSYATRPMQLATYFCSGDLTDGGEDWGHYALAVPLYTHFTSPLRRYPDIIVHRTLAATIEAEEMLKKNGGKLFERCFTGLVFEKVESFHVQKALLDAGMKYSVPGTQLLADVATHCNERKLASRYVKDATDRLYMWLLLRNKDVFLSEARVLGLGPKFMSVYVTKLAMERRIYYDEVEGLSAEWLDATSTLVLNYYPNNRSHNKKGSSNKFKTVEEVAMVSIPYNTEMEMESEEEVDAAFGDMGISDSVVVPVFFPLVLHILSTIPVALHPIGGDDGPIDIGARLYMSSYFS
ncbi:DIS3-like exonuclease 2 [Lactuca sativa]|nr:DIS3-like exonuclease 2 [Lactuca sativa]